MRLILTFPSAAFLAVLLAFAPGRGVVAQTEDAVALRRTLAEFTRLRADLDRVNAEVASLKRADRSLRDDYQLRDRMADAEALAQKVTRAEARLRGLGWAGATPDRGPLVGPPQALPQDGSVELEAKAGLFADQARKLDGEATVLAKAADELRSRKALRRRAGAWDRDPFLGLEGSKRSLAVSVSTQKSTTVNPPSGSTTGSTPIGMVPPSGGSDSTNKEVAASPVAPEAAASAKTSPIPQTVAQDRQSFEQRLYLDPTTVAELRHALGTAGATSDPDALDRAATVLRARARALSAQAQALLVKSRAP
jgi:hypothetical protein